MKTNNKVDVADATASKALSFLINHRVKNPSFVRAMATRLSKRTRTTVQRQQVEAWLHPDAKKRVQPKLGVGLLLIHEGNKVLERVTTIELGPQKRKGRK